MLPGWFSGSLPIVCPGQPDCVLKAWKSSACPPVVPGKGAVKTKLPGGQVILVNQPGMTQSWACLTA